MRSLLRRRFPEALAPDQMYGVREENHGAQTTAPR